MYAILYDILQKLKGLHGKYVKSFMKVLGIEIFSDVHKIARVSYGSNKVSLSDKEWLHKVTRSFYKGPRSRPSYQISLFWGLFLPHCCTESSLIVL